MVHLHGILFYVNSVKRHLRVFKEVLHILFFPISLMTTGVAYWQQRRTVSKPDIENNFNRRGAPKNFLFSD